MDDELISARPASTVVLLRDTERGLETLLLRRNSALAFAGGAWVFPGGAIDQSELDNAPSEALAAQVAAVRETYEECGLIVSPQALVYFCHWTTPASQSKRFSTWFFAARVLADSKNIVIDGGEIHDFKWILLEDAVKIHLAAELRLMPPTLLSLRLINHYPTAAEACAGLAKREPYRVTPRLSKIDGQLVSLYPGDAGYKDCDATIDGPRHRLLFDPQGLQYIYSGDDVSMPAMDRP
jgi:8-oxo-dGTP pyrophosphatase MutT (NUDIX family)